MTARDDRAVGMCPDTVSCQGGLRRLSGFLGTGALPKRADFRRFSGSDGASTRLTHHIEIRE
jgi:hypothetical protein